MLGIDVLLAKRAALVVSQEQLVGQVNRVGGAIAQLDELVSEQRAAEAPEEVAACPPPAPHVMQPVTKFEPCGQCVEPLGCEAHGCDMGGAA